MSRISYSPRSRADLVRLYQFLAQYDDAVAQRALATIINSVDYIAAHPYSGSPVPDRTGLRRTVVDFGATGYLIFHKRYEQTDVNLIARIIHQKEWYDEFTIGLD